VQLLAARLDDRFRLLTGGSRTALPRQQALRAVVDWSYDLLFEEQRRVFERLSAFPGGCTLATAEAVCADDDVPADDLEDILEALVDKSLVIAQPGDGEIRFVQLQTLAQYGREKLVERGDVTPVRERMVAHYAAHCANSLEAFAGTSQREWLAVVVADYDNFRAATEWAIDTGDAEGALRIAGALGWLHWLTGMGLEGKRWLDDAFRASGPTTPGTRALALFGRGFLSFLSGEPEHTNADMEEPSPSSARSTISARSPSCWASTPRCRSLVATSTLPDAFAKRRPPRTMHSTNRSTWRRGPTAAPRSR
jgi:hypothetical protein